MSVSGMAAIPAQQVFRSGIDVVHLGVAVVDKAGSAVSSLTQDDFVVYEGGKRQELKYFARGDAREGEVPPLHIGLVFDTSGSMAADMELARSAAIKFLNRLPRAEDADEILERRHRLLDRRVRVPVVEPVKVDVVGLQAPQRVLAGRDDGLAARAAAVRVAGIQVAAELGGDDEAVAASRVAADVVAEDLLGVTLRVEVRGVDEVAADLDVAVHDLLRFLDGGAPPEVFAERHRTEAQRADTESRSAERYVVIEWHENLP